MRVLFVSGIDGFCHRYQVLHRAAQLASCGAQATIRHFADPRLLDDVAASDLLFLYRVPATEHVRSLLTRSRERGVASIGAIDDLIFVDDPALLPPLDHLPPGEHELWRRGVRRYGATLAACDAFVAPTEPLVEAARALGWRAYLHRNAVSPAELELARRARAAAAPRASGEVVLGYFSGTPTHDEDFASIASPLADLLRTEPRVRLLVVGPLALPRELDAFAPRIERRPLVPWHLLPQAMAAADVSLAPLAPGRPFAAAKGEIKYLEAAALAIPTIASATSAYRHAIDDGRNGRLATSAGEWRAALGELVRDAGLRARLGEAAADDVRSRFDEATRAAELQAVLADVLRARSPAAAARPDALAGPFDAEPLARHALEPDACPALEPAEPSLVSPPLGDGARLVQRFRPERDGLVRVDVHSVTYGQTLAHELTLTLRRDDGTLAGRATVAACEAPDRGWLALELPACEARSAGRVYELELAARGATTTAVSFGLAAPGDERGAAACPGLLGAARSDGGELAGPLALRAFAAWQEALGHEAPDVAARDAGRPGETTAPPGFDAPRAAVAARSER